MAIAKIINYKDSGQEALLGAINYCRNPVKADKTPFRMTGISDDPVKAFKLNKLLHHQEMAKRLFKILVISMEAEWPTSRRNYGHYVEKMQKLMAAASNWWAREGFQSTGAIHCNTAHPHFHLVIDTCNAQTGKQLSQSPKMLHRFKDAMSAAMQELELGEEVLQHITINEEEYFAEDDEDVFPLLTAEEEPPIFSAPSLNEEDLEFNDFLLVESEIYRHEEPAAFREMCHIIDRTKGREMCSIVDSGKGREMCHIVSKPNTTRWKF